MIKSEYDNIDELVQEDIDEIDDYESAKEAHYLLMDALHLSDAQKTILKGSYVFLEELHHKQLLSQYQEETNTIRIGQNTFRYDDEVYGATRSITGREVVDWICSNHLQDSHIYCADEYLYTRMFNVKDKLHYREISLNWGTSHSKYEVIEDRLKDE